MDYTTTFKEDFTNIKVILDFEPQVIPPTKVTICMCVHACVCVCATQSMCEAVVNMSEGMGFEIESVYPTI